MPPDPVAFEGALNGLGPNLGHGLREPPPKAPGIVKHSGAQRHAAVNTHGLGPVGAGVLGGEAKLLAGVTP